MIGVLQSGKWLTPARRRVYPRLLLLATALAVIVWTFLSLDMVDPNGRPLGTDFSNVYAAGKLTLQGQPWAAYDPVLQHAAEKQVFGGQDVPFYGWHYPPLFLFAAAVLALLPYGWALFAWMAVTLPIYVMAVRSIVPHKEAIILALAFPGVLVNLGHGQNGFLTAGLLGGALVLLQNKPVQAGILFGLLAYKPQFGVLIPLVLAASGRWPAFASAAATVLVAAAITVLVYGTDVWSVFLESTAFTRSVVLEAGGTGWEKIQSIFSAVRMWGGSIEAAYAAQFTLAALLAASLVWLWRQPVAFNLKAAALATASLLATPYVLDYDLVVLGIAIAFLAAHGLSRGFRDYEITLLAAAWVAPLIARSIAGATHVPLGLLVMVSLYALIVRRVVTDCTASQSRSTYLAQA